jgi:hypothetical protein
MRMRVAYTTGSSGQENPCSLPEETQAARDGRDGSKEKPLETRRNDNKNKALERRAPLSKQKY